MIPVNQLVAYLPHNLEFYGGGDRWTLYSIGAEGDIVLKNGLHTEVIHAANVGVEYQPILRPFTTITNEDAEEYEAQVWGEDIATWAGLAGRAFKTTKFFMKKKLDVFGMIEQGLAIEEWVSDCDDQIKALIDGFTVK